MDNPLLGPQVGNYEFSISSLFGPWASLYEANGQNTMTLNNYRSGQSHRTLNGKNPCSGLRDMYSDPWESPCGSKGQMGKWPWHCTATACTGCDNSIDLQMEKIYPAVSEICFLQKEREMCSGPWASPYGSNVQVTITLHNCNTGLKFSKELQREKIC